MSGWNSGLVQTGRTLALLITISPTPLVGDLARRRTPGGMARRRVGQPTVAGATTLGTAFAAVSFAGHLATTCARRAASRLFRRDERLAGFVDRSLLVIGA
jgi:hypothetical protein